MSSVEGVKQEQGAIVSEVRVGVGVIVCRGDQVLLGKRIGSHGEGTWQPPGGHLEVGETWEGCARREVLEETGLSLMDEPKYLCTTNDRHSESLHYVTIMMQVRSFSGEPQILEMDKCLEWKWFTWNELPKPLFLPFDKFVQSNNAPSLLGQVDSDVINFFNLYRKSFLLQDSVELRKLFSQEVQFSTEEGDLSLEGDRVHLNLRHVLETYKRYGLEEVDFQIIKVEKDDLGKMQVDLKWFFSWPKKQQVFSCSYGLEGGAQSAAIPWRISQVANYSYS